MYLDFFKFKKEPFHITPDPDFLFLSPSHQDALNSIYYGIEQRKGFIAVTGEVGVGKTTILRSYLEKIDLQKIRVVYLFNALLSFDRLLKQIISELDIPAVDGDTSELLDSILRHATDEYKNGHNVVLIIDEAQNMPVETLARLLMLSNMETSHHKLLQIILVGQPELENRLSLPELKQLNNSIAIRKRIVALQRDESLAYIQHRLIMASSFYNPVFTRGALRRIVKEAGGIPRTINILCDNALITAFGRQRNPANGNIARGAIKDLRGGQQGFAFKWRYVSVPALAVLVGVVALASMSLLRVNPPPVRTEIVTGKIPVPQPSTKVLDKAEAEPSSENGAKAESEPPTPEAPAADSNKSFYEMVPPASVQAEVPRETQVPVVEEASSAPVQAEITKETQAPMVEKVSPASPNIAPPQETQVPATEEASVPKDGKSPAQGVVAKDPKSQSFKYIVQYGSYVDEETAREIKARLEAKGYKAVIKLRKHPDVVGNVYVVQIQTSKRDSGADKSMNPLSGEIEDEPAIVRIPSH